MKRPQSTHLHQPSPNTSSSPTSVPLEQANRHLSSSATDSNQPPQTITTTIIATTHSSSSTPFAPLHIHQPAIPHCPAEYPLWHTPTPPALKKFCFDLNGVPTELVEVEQHESQICSPAPVNQTNDLLSSHSRKRPAPRDSIDSDDSARQMVADLTSAIPVNSDGKVSAHKRRIGGSHHGGQASEAFHIATETTAVLRKGAGLLRPPRVSSVQANRVPSVPLTPFPESQIAMYTAIVDTNTDELMTEDADVDLTNEVPNLPSPRLSPTTTMSHPVTAHPTTLHLLTSQFSSIPPADPQSPSARELEIVADRMLTLSPFPPEAMMVEQNSDSLVAPTQSVESSALIGNSLIASLTDIPHIISTFDTLPPQLKSYLLLHLLRRCPYPTLQFISSIILPTLKRDFLGLLPIELSYHVLEYLDVKSIGRCGAVGRQWQHVVDGEGAEIAVWKRRLVLEGWYDEAEVQSEMAVVRGRNALSKSSSNNSSSNATLRPPFKISKHVPEDNADPSSDDDFAMSLIPTSSRRNTFSEEQQSAMSNGAGSSGASGSSNNNNARGVLSSPNAVAMDMIEVKPRPVPQGVYKTLYARHHRLRKRWLAGQYRHVSFPGHGFNVVTCLQFDGDKVVSGSDDMSIHVYDTLTGACRKKLEGHEGGVWALQYWNNVLVSGSTDRTVRVWDMERGVCTHLFEGHTSTVRCLMIVTPTKSDETGEMSPSVPLIVTGSRDATLRVWRLPIPGTDAEYFPPNNSSPPADGNSDSAVANPYAVHVLQGHTNSVRAIAGHGNVLISGSYDCTVRMWDLTSGENVWVFRGHREKVYSVGYCQELKRAVSGSMDATVRIWCTRTGSSLHVLEGHTSLVGLLEISPQYLVSAAADSSLRVWSPITGKCLATLVGHAAAITCFHHDPKLNRIVSGSDGGVKVWELSSAGAGGPSRSTSSRSPPPVYGRLLRDLVTNVQGVWRVRMDERRLVCAVQKEQGRTFFEVLDFAEEAEGTVLSEAEDVTLPDVVTTNPPSATNSPAST
ncbi:hypothetical protein SeMB42_g07495 [Synchytrium endobioticum]|uniref:F-box domain-containing protein n=1 Tax=Synchytrium endobioticum TaxID=286115 RepID=A0A507CH62_9FUNG|nr:hypothetical protein SeMB42_g07495 [Synchytrium endobioticum]TPX37344.1 hypothetical protein SeLEV6574_g07912 [Synchytrium endobioticum]